MSAKYSTLDVWQGSQFASGPNQITSTMQSLQLSWLELIWFVLKLSFSGSWSVLYFSKSAATLWARLYKFGVQSNLEPE